MRERSGSVSSRFDEIGPRTLKRPRASGGYELQDSGKCYKLTRCIMDYFCFFLKQIGNSVAATKPCFNKAKLTQSFNHGSLLFTRKYV